MRWQIQEAKQRFSAVLRAVEEGGPQMITKHGKDIAVIISADEYRRLRGDTTNIMDFMRASPYLDVEVDFERAHDVPRQVELRG